MRNEPNLRIEQYRDNSHPGYVSDPGKNWGSFLIPGKYGLLRVLSSGLCEPGNQSALNWEHVSVSYPDRTPSWEDMDKIKKMFWRDDETVVQFHPRESVKINNHEFCLHLWKMADTEYVLPPSILVGL